MQFANCRYTGVAAPFHTMAFGAGIVRQELRAPLLPNKLWF